MKQLKHSIIAGIFFVLAAGSLAHFIYEWTGESFIAGFFVPINESIWEHMKLLFFPMLLYSIPAALKLRPDYPCIAPSLCLGLLAGTFLIPVLFYAYTGILKRDIFVLDIGTFILSIIIAFSIAYKFTLSCKAKSCAVLLYCLVLILFLCFVFFTYHPPDCEIFDDPTASAFNSYEILYSIETGRAIECTA